MDRIAMKFGTDIQTCSAVLNIIFEVVKLQENCLQTSEALTCSHCLPKYFARLMRDKDGCDHGRSSSCLQVRRQDERQAKSQFHTVAKLCNYNDACVKELDGDCFP